MLSDFNIVVLISGRGSNFLNLIENARNYRISAVITDNAAAAGLDHAKKAGIESVVIARDSFNSAVDYRRALADAVQAFNPNLVALAGFMQLIKAPLLTKFENKIINIHPSILPALPGLDTHARAIAEGDRFHGCTVHVVDKGMDTGPIIAQAKCPIEPSDDEHSLAARVLKLEHKLYPWVVTNIASGDITIMSGLVKFSLKASDEAKNLALLLPS